MLSWERTRHSKFSNITPWKFKFTSLSLDAPLMQKPLMQCMVNTVLQWTLTVFGYSDSLGSCEADTRLLFILICCTVLRYMPIHASYLDKLAKINNKILRILLNQSVCTPVPQLYEMFGLLPIEKLYSFQVLLLVFKCIHCSHLVPSVYVDRFCDKHWNP